MDFSGHWHGYGPWIGTNAQYHTEYLRRPNPIDPEWLKSQKAPDPNAFTPFERRAIPPLRTGHYLLRRPAELADNTWKEAEPALRWLVTTYQANPPARRPDGGAVDAGLDARAHHARTDITNGVDVVWSYYVPGDRMISYAVIACPNRHLPEITCPLGL
ncbi:hypothetical protein [Kitasatospora sp. A2-31]|uniref:hypothetical protein n=1 Tax=Kitasatospora sp. A2-31 TaxID=2916414 RepID=UPI001EEF2C1A|nr:hypothetical protein [Kitasatospora sp. A2-31]MCG6499174.1 hypothetical protein [Kitasatospora sp. A2-31]